MVTCPVPSVPPHRRWGSRTGPGPEQLGPGSCGHYPSGFNYCGELVSYWLAQHLLEWHFSQEFINGSRCGCSSKRQDRCSQVYPVMSLFRAPLPAFLSSGISSPSLFGFVHPFSWGAFLEKKHPPPMAHICRGANANLHLGC